MSTIQRPKTPIDETLWRDQVWYRQWGPLNELTVMDYFRMSTFFDHTSNNGALFQQMLFNPQFREELRTPELFNNRLKTMTGVEYMLATGSTESGVWVIRKQLRRSPRWDESIGGEAEDLTVLAAYYIVRENIYQAPSIGAVLQNRMLTVLSALRSALSIATNLPSFAPTTTPAQPSQPSSASQQPNASQPPPSTQSSLAPSTAPHPGSPSHANDPRLLTQALSLSLKHKNEYLDDHAPLLGDPASFLQSQPGSQRGGTPALQVEVAKKQAPVAVKKGGGQAQTQAPVRKKSKGLAP